MIFPREEHTAGCPIPNGQPWRHMHVSNIIQPEQVVFRNLEVDTHTYTHTHTHTHTHVYERLMQKESINLKRNKEGHMGRVEGRKGK